MKTQTLTQGAGGEPVVVDTDALGRPRRDVVPSEFEVAAVRAQMAATTDEGDRARLRENLRLMEVARAERREPEPDFEGEVYAITGPAADFCAPADGARAEHERIDEQRRDMRPGSPSWAAIDAKEQALKARVVTACESLRDAKHAELRRRCGLPIRVLDADGSRHLQDWATLAQHAHVLDFVVFGEALADAGVWQPLCVGVGMLARMAGRDYAKPFAPRLAALHERVTANDTYARAMQLHRAAQAVMERQNVLFAALLQSYLATGRVSRVAGRG